MLVTCTKETYQPLRGTTEVGTNIVCVKSTIRHNWRIHHFQNSPNNTMYNKPPLALPLPYAHAYTLTAVVTCLLMWSVNSDWCCRQVNCTVCCGTCSTRRGWSFAACCTATWRWAWFFCFLAIFSFMNCITSAHITYSSWCAMCINCHIVSAKQCLQHQQSVTKLTWLCHWLH